MTARQTNGKVTRARLLVLAVSVGLVAIMLWRLGLGRILSYASIASALAARSAGHLDAHSSPRRILLDTSGLNTVGSHVPRWKPSASLEQIRDIWTGAVGSGVIEIDQLLADRTLADNPRVSLLMSKAAVLNFAGDAENAYTVLTDLRSFVADHERLAPPHLASVIFYQGVTALRRGENDNCVMCRGESACIIPISEAAVHTNPTGSRLAIAHFTEYLARFPDDLEVRWLLNLAHMTLGEYPDGVDPRYRLDLSRFFESKSTSADFTRSDRPSASTAITRPAERSWMTLITTVCSTSSSRRSRPTNPCRITATGETEPSKIERGKPVSAASWEGWFAIKPIMTTTATWTSSYPAGAWLPYPIRPSLLRNTGGGVFVDVTRQAGLVDPVNCNGAAWSDYDNDGFVDLFIGCERQVNRLYRNKGDGTFEEVAA